MASIESNLAVQQADEAVAEPAVKSRPTPTFEQGRTFFPLALAVLLPSLFFFVLPPLSKSGLWDPYELNVADLARRLALNLLHAGSLALQGADNSMPHLNDLGRPELPFTSIAVGFKLFGLHEWAGRLPLALWGLLGVLATYAFVARLVDRRAGAYSALVLTTTPLYFVQARTMLGDIVMMAALAISFGAFLLALLEDGDDARPWVARGAYLLIGCVGLFVGYYSRGAVIGVGLPLVSIGLTWGLARVSGRIRFDRTGTLLGIAALAIGGFVFWRGYIALGEHTTNLSMLVGAMIKPPQKYPTFDTYIAHLGPALAPWSAFVPFAMGRLFIAPPGKSGPLRERESLGRAAIVVGSAVALFAHTLLAPKIDLIAFSAPALLAAACGIALRDYERGAHPSMAVGVGVCVLLGVFHHDFHELPDKAYQAFAIAAASFPESFKEHALTVWTVVLVGFGGASFLTWAERDPKRTPFAPETYTRVLQALRAAWDGMLALAYFAMIAGTSLAGLAIWVGMRTHARWLPTVSLQVREGALNAWWITALAPLAIVFGLLFACDVWLWAFAQARKFSSESVLRGFEPFENLYAKWRESADVSAGLAIVAALMYVAIPASVLAYLFTHGTKWLIALALAFPSGVAFFLAMGLFGDALAGNRVAFLGLLGILAGGILCVSYYPALANQLSPKEVFESYERIHRAQEPLALLGVGGRTAAYYAGGQPTSFNDPGVASQWLLDDSTRDGRRRFLATRADELPRLNQIYRERSSPRTNLPVLDARSSQILLVSSALESGEKNQNPLNKIILASPPKPQRKLEVNMEDKLLVLGYDIIDHNGRYADVVAPGRKYRMRTYYRVLAPITTEWEAFIHIDGYRRRHNGDHKPMDGKYPFILWLKDDLLADEYEFALEPNFTPGLYTIYFGLFVGETRLKVKSGPSDGENRINGGALRVQ